MRGFILTLALLVVGCGRSVPPPLVGLAPALTDQSRDRVLRFAQKTTSSERLTVGDVTFDSDPVGFVRAAYWTVRIDLFQFDVATDVSADGLAILKETAEVRGQTVEDAKAGDIAALVLNDGRTFPAVVMDTAEKTLTVRGWFTDGPNTTTVDKGRVAFAWDPFR